MTGGRSELCDVRIYLSDVADRHAQLVTDAVTGQVSVQVFAPLLVNDIEVVADETMPLQHRDNVRIGARAFRFDYGMGATCVSVAGLQRAARVRADPDRAIKFPPRVAVDTAAPTPAKKAGRRSEAGAEVGQNRACLRPAG
jgi:hypothetical protein